jgi:hypothetical protein
MDIQIEPKALEYLNKNGNVITIRGPRPAVG